MSSSESEEFFDALDITPAKGTHPVYGKHELNKDHAAGDLLTKEERELLQAKQIVEIRRKLEDEAIENKLRALQERKKKELEEEIQQQSLESNADDNVKRRKKLEEMRQLMCAENTSDTVRKNAQPLAGQVEHSAGQSEGSNSTESTDIEVKDNVHNSQIESRLELAGSSSGKEIISSHSTQGDIDKHESSSHRDENSLNRHSKVVEGISEKSDKPIGAVTEHLKELSTEDSLEPDLIQSVKSSSLGRNKSPVAILIEKDDDFVKAAGLGKSDLQSEDSKAIDAAEMPPPPMVPPRRKKKATSTGSLNEVVANSSEAIKKRPTTLTTDHLTVPSSDISGCLLTAPSPQVGRKPLDLNNATKGDVIVTAIEKEDTKAVNDIKIEGRDTVSIWDNESIAESHTSPVDSPPSPKNEDKAKVISAELKSNSFPRGQQRLTSTASLSPTEQAILDQVSVLNLDTGLRIPIGVAEEKVPVCINPLSLHIMRRTKEYLSDSSLNKQEQGEGECVAEGEDQTIKTVKGLEKKKKKLKSLFGKAKDKLKLVKDEVFHNADSSSSDEEEDGERKMIQIKASKSYKGPHDFDLLVPVQYKEGAHNGAVWTMKFSHCGRLLASGGKDNLLKVWVLKDAYNFFDDMRVKYNEEQKKKMSLELSEDSVESEEQPSGSLFQSQEEEVFSPFNSKPFCVYKGHTADILDVSWSKNFFILTSSMDKTVRLWHVSRKECLCCFQHIDFVTAIAFHPKDDRYFLSGSLDGKLRLWNIPDRKVELWNEVSGSTKLITAANFCMKGKFAVVGTYDGRCVFYSTEQLKYYTQIHVRSTRGKNSKGRKITGVEPLTGEDKILVTSNDSRVRIYDLRDLTLTCKYKGCVNNSSQIKAHFSHDGRFIVCGSEDHFVYIWRTQHEFHKFSSARRDRSDYWESIKAHSAVVTVALFAPKPNLVIKNQFEYLDSEDKQSTPEVRGEVLISADYNGTIKCFINKFKPTAS